MNLVTITSLWEAERPPRKPRKPSEPKAPKEPTPEGQAQTQGRQQAAAKKSAGVAGDAKAKGRKASTLKRLATVKAKKKAATTAALAANKAKRQAAKAARKKKPLPAGQSGPKPTKAPADHVSAQIAHCMLALNKKRGKSVKAAWNICRWAMTKYGYLKGPYRVNTKLPKATKQTQKGVRRSFQHGMEKGPLNKGIDGTGGTKYRKFKDLFRGIEKEVTPKGGL